MVSRLWIQRILGAIWFVDGLLQLKPKMFTSDFVNQVILPTGQGQPTWVSSIVNWGGHLVLPQIGLWNLLFALIQILLGLALMFNIKTKPTLQLSILWSLLVWAFGEGFGQLLSGQSLLLTGAPGAVLLYALIAVAIWPDKEQSRSGWRPETLKFARYSLGLVWLAGALLQVQGAYRSAEGLSQVIAVDWLANAMGHHGPLVSMALGGLEFALGIMILFNVRMRVMVSTSIVLSVLFWWVGQSFGQIFSPLGTDLNSGPLLALLSVSALPSWWTLKVKKSWFKTPVHWHAQAHR